MTRAQGNGETVIVIGAGANGLAVARALREQAIPVRIVDRAGRAGDAWRQRHPQLRLNTHRDLSCLPGLALPAGSAAFPSRDDIIRYLEEYAARLDVPVDYAVTVERIEQSSGGWAIETDCGTYYSEHVVIATGREQVPYIPGWPGRESYRGRLIHAHEFGDADQYRGSKVLVIGCGNSGSDILNHLSTIETAGLLVSVRNGPVVFPRYLYGIPVQRLSPVLAVLPVRVVDLLLALTERIAFGNLGKWGLPRHARGGASRLVEDGVAPAIDTGFVRALKSGRLQVVPEIRSFDATAVVLVDGRRVEADVVIAATGYRTGLDTMLGNMDVLDESARPVINGAEQHASYPGLWFTGMRPRLPGFFHMACKTSVEIASAIAAARQSRGKAVNGVKATA